MKSLLNVRRLPSARRGRKVKPVQAPIDLALTFRSPGDDTEKPYRLYLPSAYDGKRAVPLLVALHGTSGDQNKYFDEHAYYHDGIYKREAEKRGLAVVCPRGRDLLGQPTEWRGIGENDVLTVIKEVCRRFLIDRERIICTGLSMGGTGTTYLCFHYPDLFAAGIPLSSTYNNNMSEVINLRHVPMFFVQGEKDWPVYANDGPIPISRKMQDMEYNGKLWTVPGAGHDIIDLSTTERVLDWAMKQRRVRYPRRVTFRAYLPIHGRAYWTEIQGIDRIGYFAEIDARIEKGNRVSASIKNATQVVIRPEPELLDLDAPIEVTVNGRPAFHGLCRVSEEIRLVVNDGAWTSSIVRRREKPRTSYRTHKIGTALEPPTWTGAAESSMGNWMADMMRDATGADIAICNCVHYRGIPLEPGQDVYLMDLFNWIRPFISSLGLFDIRGSDLREIMEDNIRNEAQHARFLIQVSGCRYAFDRNRPQGQRIVATDIDQGRTYKVVCESHSLTRTDTMFLGGRYGKIPFELHELTNISAAWRYIDKNGGKIEAALEGRVQDVT